MVIEKIISGGQTGVDRAALDAAQAAGVACGGWCPAGRAADDGPIPARYPLQETLNIDHTVRTGANVRDSDATLMLNRGLLQGGTAYAVEIAKHMNRPVMVIDLDAPPDLDMIVAWLEQHEVRVLHIGGPREASRPGIYAQARDFVEGLLRMVGRGV
ncbi:MAG TPA: molybdenum cofactor carrier [Gammaproteobacteria bacterium]|nr:molybdenum cofactor carrier [Gammaproteobacteria bacterium]